MVKISAEVLFQQLADAINDGISKGDFSDNATMRKTRLNGNTLKYIFTCIWKTVNNVFVWTTFVVTSKT